MGDGVNAACQSAHDHQFRRGARQLGDQAASGLFPIAREIARPHHRQVNRPGKRKFTAEIEYRRCGIGLPESKGVTFRAHR